MARILAYTSPSRGDLYPVAAMLAEAATRGHDVAVRTLACEVPTMLAQGFRAAPIDPRIEAIEQVDWRGGNPREGLRLAVETFCARARYDSEDLRRAVEEEGPDAVIVDVNCWGAAAAAEAWGGPWAKSCPYPLPLRSRTTPPFGPGLRPARGPLGRTRDRLLRPLVLGTLEKIMRAPVNEIRSGAGLAPVRTADDLYTRAPLVLYTTAEPFEYPRDDWPENVVLVGPCEWEPTAEQLPWLHEIERPIVLVTTSSEFQDDGRLVQTALTALADEPVFVVATVPAGDPAAFDVPANARVERFVPHAPVLERAVCAVTHGGMGATQKALARGVPVCAVPFGRDQLEVARRVEVSGAGTRLPAKRLRPDRLRAKVAEARKQAGGARQIAAAFATAGGGAAAADAIESQLLAAAPARG